MRPSGANPPERASSRHIRTWMCDHREQIPRRERHPVTSARGCATTGSKSPERASSRHIRTWMCDHREQIPRRESHPVTSARGCATIGSKSPGESVIPSHPHVDVRPPGANSFRRSHRNPRFPYSFGRSRTFEGVSSGHCQPLSKTDTMPLCRKCVQASGIIFRYIPP